MERRPRGNGSANRLHAVAVGQRPLQKSQVAASDVFVGVAGDRYVRVVHRQYQLVGSGDDHALGDRAQRLVAEAEAGLALVQRQQCRDMRAGGVAHQINMFCITADFLGVVMHPSNG